MGWWDSFKENANAVSNSTLNGAKWVWNNASLANANVAGNQLAGGAKWVWNNTALPNITNATFKFTVNTTFHVLEQGLALRQAIPTLIYNEEARKIVDGFAYVVIQDVLPLVALNVMNNSVQNYFRTDYDEEESSIVYSQVINMLTLGNYLVAAYTWKRGAETFVRVAVLDAFAPSAFNSNKIKTPPSLCNECDIPRKIKGSVRELGILWTNQAFIAGISYLPYVGEPTSKVLTIVNNGRYITRTVTPERCEGHKYMEQEFVLALGLTYELTSWLMNTGLQSSTGPLPYLYLRTLQHILLAFSVNLAAHMTVPLVEPKNATIPDLLDYYERVWRFILDVLWAGLMKRVPIDFKLLPGEVPFISLSRSLRFFANVFNSDLESLSDAKLPKFFKTSKDLLIPPMFRNSYDFFKDPVLATYWPAIREGAINAFDVVNKHGKTKLVATMAWSPKTAAAILELKFGIPPELTKIVLMLSKEEDFWALTQAIKGWFERHSSKMDTVIGMPKTELIALNGDKSVPLLPSIQEAPINEIVSPLELVPDKTPVSVDIINDASQLKASEEKESDSSINAISKLKPVRAEPVMVGADNPLMFLSTRRRVKQSSNVEETSTLGLF